MKLLFVYAHPKPEYWKDGLYYALQELEKDFDIIYQNINFDKEIKSGFDFVLGWGGFRTEIDIFLSSFKCPKGLCIGGNVFKIPTNKYDVLFYETDWVKMFLELDKLNMKLVKAFGINKEMFSPFTSPKLWDYMGVGALANWKRWDKMVEKKGNRLVMGEYQDNNEWESAAIASFLLKNGVMVSNRVLPHQLPTFYNLAKVVYIPASIFGGGERVVLEARSCGCEVEIEEDNPKLKELLTCPIPSYQDYAKKLKEGICG